MEMTWLETIELLGVDLLAVLLLAVILLDRIEHGVQSCRELLQARRTPRQRPSAATQLATVSFE
jgi:hypothetical protein